MMKEKKIHRELPDQIKKTVKLFYLEGKELLERIRSLSRNESIEEVEFDMCKFNKKPLQVMLEVLPTLKQAKGLKFTSCWYPSNKGEASDELEKASEIPPCGIERIEGLETTSFDEIFKEDISYWHSLRELSLDFKSGTDADKIRKQMGWKEEEDCLFRKIIVGKESVTSFAARLKKFTQLTPLTIDFLTFWEIVDDGVKIFAFNGLKYLLNLTSLSLNCSGCPKLTDDAFYSIAYSGLRHLPQLEFLALDFNGCNKLGVLAVRNLAYDGLKHLQKLKSLSLCLSNCENMKFPGVKSLACESLEELTLDFSNCQMVTDKTIKSIEFIKNLTQLKSFVMKFKDCREITEGGISRLGSQILLSLKQLKLRSDYDKILEFKSELYHQEGPQARQPYTLFFPEDKSLVFPRPQTNPQVQKPSAELRKSKSAFFLEEDFAAENLKREVKYSLICLAKDQEVPSDFDMANYNLFRMLTLDFFPHCNQITNEGLRRLAFEGLKYFRNLTSLNLDFRGCKNISNEGMSSLTYAGLRDLKGLSSLTLNFSSCGVGDAGVKSLACEGLQNFQYLTNLTLKFEKCSNLTDEGVSILAAKGLNYLTGLTSLNLDFSDCKRLTDEGINFLGDMEMRNLVHLRSLDLKLKGNLNITDARVNSLLGFIAENLGELKSLSLNLAQCERVNIFGLAEMIRRFENLMVELDKKPHEVILIE